MIAEHLQALFDCHYWAHRKIWECIMPLSHEQFHQELDYSVGSIHQQGFHMMTVEDFWFTKLYDLEAPAQPQPRAKYDPRTAFKAKWEQVEQMICNYLQTLAASRLSDTITVAFADGVARSSILWQIISHSLDCRAQTLAMLRKLGAPTVAQDYIQYVWNK